MMSTLTQALVAVAILVKLSRQFKLQIMLLLQRRMKLKLFS